jgi:hypothetical protein
MSGITEYAAIARVACTFRKKYWDVGEVYRGHLKPPQHFEITSEVAVPGDEVEIPVKKAK